MDRLIELFDSPKGRPYYASVYTTSFACLFVLAYTVSGFANRNIARSSFSIECSDGVNPVENLGLGHIHELKLVAGVWALLLFVIAYCSSFYFSCHLTSRELSKQRHPGWAKVLRWLGNMQIVTFALAIAEKIFWTLLYMRENAWCAWMTITGDLKYFLAFAGGLSGLVVRAYLWVLDDTPSNTNSEKGFEEKKPQQFAHDTLPVINDRDHHTKQRGSHVIKILFLGANPTGTTQLALTQEVQAIKSHLRSSQHGNQFQVEQEWAVKLSDLNASLLRHRPDIVHFSGHGSNAGELVLESESGAPATVNPAALTNLFKILKRNIRCVVLNACFSAPQAEAISQHIDCVVGMTTAVGDKGAVAFAWAFYEALGLNASVQDAFDLGCNQVDLSRLPDKDVPKLVPRDGVKPQEVYLLNPQ